MTSSNPTKATLFLALQLMAMIGFVSWILIDPVAVREVDGLIGRVTTFGMDDPESRFVWTRAFAILIGASIVLSILAGDVRGFLSWTSPRWTIRRLLLLTMIVAAWLGIAVNYRQLAWEGKRLRSTNRIHRLAEVAKTLDADWPSDAGEISGLGPFTAYPFGRPRLLLLLTPHPLESTNTVITAIEKSDDGSLRFELGGDDGGDWIEWHPSGSHPTNFAGGLDEFHQLQRSTRLDDQWYLVRYVNGHQRK